MPLVIGLAVPAAFIFAAAASLQQRAVRPMADIGPGRAGGAAALPRTPRRAWVTGLSPPRAGEPGSADGNVTAAVILQVPTTPMPAAQRLAAVAAVGGRLRSGTRPLASRFVMRVAGALVPVPLHVWFARTVYGRRFFHAIVLNIPGPPVPLTLTGLPLPAAYPVLWLAPGAPLAVGALGWHGHLCIGLVADPDLVPNTGDLMSAIEAVMTELGG